MDKIKDNGMPFDIEEYNEGLINKIKETCKNNLKNYNETMNYLIDRITQDINQDKDECVIECFKEFNTDFWRGGVDDDIRYLQNRAISNFEYMLKMKKYSYTIEDERRSKNYSKDYPYYDYWLEIRIKLK